MAQKKYYVVWAGNETGIFDRWADCKVAVEGFPGAKYKSYDTLAEATAAYRGDPEEQLTLFRAMARRPAQRVNYEAFPEIAAGAIAVDAACSRNPGPVEYQGVEVSTGTRYFHYGPIPAGTNNIGEFLAIVHALAWLKQQGRPNTVIYSDSRTGIAWVRAGKARTQIQPTADNAQIRQLIARAEAWLAQNRITNPILKWDTQRWGEIPADFGRKG